MILNELYNDDNFNLALYLKSSQLQRNLPSLDEEHLKIACSHLWERKCPRSFNQAISEMMKLTADEIVVILSCKAVIQGAEMSLDDYDNIFKEEQYEKA